MHIPGVKVTHARVPNASGVQAAAEEAEVGVLAGRSACLCPCPFPFSEVPEGSVSLIP